MILIEIELKDTQTPKGLGVFCLHDISKGDRVWEFNPEIDREFTKEQYNNMSELNQKFLTKYGYVDDDGTWYLDAGNERFINHSNNPNIRFGNDPKSDGIAVRDISKGEELTIDYREIDAECRISLGFEDYQ